MTHEDKRNLLKKYCMTQSCGTCVFNDESEWCHKYSTNNIPEDVCDKALKIINPTDNVEHPVHYNREGSMECIDEMILIFGKEAVMDFCLCNAWKYRYRAADKNGEEDIRKSDWYLKKYKELSVNE